MYSAHDGEIHSDGVPYAHSSYIHQGWVVPGKFNIARVEQKATQKIVVLKIVEGRSDFERERSFLAKLGKTSAADYVVELKDVLEPSNGEIRYGLVEEQLDRNLRDYLRGGPSLGELDRKNLALSIVNAIASIHRKGVIHGDFKPHQVCFVPNQPGFKVKLVDFDSAFSSNDEHHRMDRYTLLYTAPEVCAGVVPRCFEPFHTLLVHFLPPPPRNFHRHEGRTRTGIGGRPRGLPAHDRGGPFPPRADPRGDPAPELPARLRRREGRAGAAVGPRGAPGARVGPERGQQELPCPRERATGGEPGETMER